jgi:hypothetical protein
MRWSVVSKIRDLSARNRDRCLMRCAAPRNNTHRISADVRRVPGTDYLESFRCLHVGFQRTWIPSHSSRPRRNWANSWRLGSHNRSSPRGGFGPGPPFPTSNPCFERSTWPRKIVRRLTRCSACLCGTNFKRCPQAFTHSPSPRLSSNARPDPDLLPPTSPRN